jgi:hypothetical protein
MAGVIATPVSLLVQRSLSYPHLPIGDIHRDRYAAGGPRLVPS